MSVSLKKRQSIDLSKNDGSGLKMVQIGLGWDAIKPKGFFAKLISVDDDIDLDASCLIFNQNYNLLDAVWFKNLQSNGIFHSGDNRTGDVVGDDETISLALDQVDNNAKYLVFTINSFTNQTFEKVENAYCRLIDNTNNTEIAKYNISEQSNHTAMIMAILYKNNNNWKMQAIGEAGYGRTFDDLLPKIQEMLKTIN